MLYNFKAQFNKNKMYTAKNMDFHHQWVVMSESIEYSEVQMGNQSPIYSGNQFPAFRTFPKAIPNYSSVGDLFEAMSLQEQIMAHPPNHPGYKCYRCYGTNRDVKFINGEVSACSECDGTEFVPPNNGLATILDRLLTIKVPHLVNRIEGPPRRARDVLLNYGSQRSIKEESFIKPDQTSRECSNCMQEAEISTILYCTLCPEYFLCSSCHNRKKYAHPYFHQFTCFNNFPPSKISVRFISDPRTMKKISQQIQSEQTSNIVQSSELESKCHSCNNFIQECYMSCLNCQIEGSKYILCPQCQRVASYIHDPNHKLDLKAIPQASKLLMSAKPSASQSDITQPTPSKTKSRMKFGESLVIFDNQLDLEDDIPQPIVATIKLPSQEEELPFYRDSTPAAPYSQCSLRSHSDVQACEDLFAKTSVQPQVKESLKYNSVQEEGEGLTHLLVKKKHKRMQSSMVNIDMQTSIQLHPQQKLEQFQQTIIPFSFSTVTSQIVTQRSIQTNPEQYIFNDYECDICKLSPIKNKRYHCRQCENFDICENCFIVRSKRHQHKDYQLIDGLDLIKKHRESIMKLDQVLCKLPVSRMSQSRLSYSRTRTELSKI